jgi:hypothetical protein
LSCQKIVVSSTVEYASGTVNGLLWRQAAIGAAIAASLSCGGAVDPSDALNGLPPGSIRLTVDGQRKTFQASGSFSSSPNAYYRFAIAGFSNDEWRALIASRTGAVGTEPADRLGIALGGPGSSTIDWVSDPSRGGSGFITIATLEGNRVRGRFEGVLVPSSLGNAVGAKHVSDGAFDVTLHPVE